MRPCRSEDRHSNQRPLHCQGSAQLGLCRSVLSLEIVLAHDRSRDHRARNATHLDVGRIVEAGKGAIMAEIPGTGHDL
jgi:hypothetical protein